ncbi:hypothetical protein jhhlp_007583 [Lomentospora prolificans]|uniref:Uncharacterized protein n=1 Tax=Lomentospora prolificans TaxID=41688 RepID=A0A2N3MZY5_9PEZI|nr:hypothetical protein jhhlp_007583 [Lomentospora prolificans]
MTKVTNKEGHWLAAGDYQHTVNRLCASDPRLRLRDPKTLNLHVPFTDDHVRVSVLEAQEDNSFLTQARFTTPESLQDHFSSSECSRPGRKAVYILEGMGPGFVSVMGQHFSLHPSIFVEQERVVVHDISWRGANDGVPLPSSLRGGRAHLRMRYHEVMSFDVAPRSFRWACGVTGKHIGVSRELKWGDTVDDGDQFLDVGMIVRKCGVWSRRKEGGGWDCLVICDPPLRRVHAGETYNDAFDVQTRPYQGGYIDFVPEEEQLHVLSGPPRTCLLDDLTFYLETHHRLIETSTNHGASPEGVVLFVKKIVASQYLVQIEHVRSALIAVQRGLTRKQDLARMPMRKVEALWSDMQAWERRMGEYLEDLEGIMIQLGIPLTDEPWAHSSYHSPSLANPPPYHKDASEMRPDPSWQDCEADFQFLLHRLRELRHRTASLNAAVTGLAGITGNRMSYKEQQRSIREAKSTKAITLIGLIFIPLAYTSSVFSMTEPYAPGQELFWVYFAASAPLILLVVLGYYILDYGYSAGSAAWSIYHVMSRLRKAVGLSETANGKDEAFEA